jgi:hypothetical protein
VAEGAAPGLEPEEPLLVTATVTFRGSLAASWRGWGVRATRTRLDEFATWVEAAHEADFPTLKPDMAIGVTNRRLVVWRPTFFRGRPADYFGDIPFERLAQVTVYRSGLVAVLTLLFRDGQIVQVEAMRGRHLREIAELLNAHIAQTP